jgi:pimeloyl-ACP methyl ester carboxylesterase/UDP:flavonoid glycosyltransferase YjiC (YdhE family)
MRARLPDESGYVVNNGVRVYYEVHGSGTPTVLLLPAWSIVHSRIWKMQVPYLARHFRVVTFDGRGNGRSDRPPDVAAYDDTEFVADAIAVLDHTGTKQAVLVALSRGAGYALRLAVQHPDRALGALFSGPAVSLHDPSPDVPSYDFDADLDTDVGWAKWNAPYWRRDWPGFVDFFMGQIFTEPHSTKPIEDAVGWGLETDPETIIHTQEAVYLGTPRRAGSAQRRATVLDLAGKVRCPCLVVHGTDDHVVPVASGERLAAALECPIVALEGSGHAPNARDPVRFNLVVRDFIGSITPAKPVRAVWVRPRDRRRRALWISSPIGLGHVLRDLAIARAVRERAPDLEIDWWAQPPVTAVLEAHGENVHPVSTQMASESAHWESEASAHDLHAFQAYRRMDEIFLANYMLFDDVVHETNYDLWVGDESWEVDHFLHDNPERKIAPYVFTTDVIGFQPTNPDDPREAELCADYNAEKIERRERFPQLRDLSLFIGGFDELPDVSFGPGLPRVRDWSARWFESVPYIVPFDPSVYADRGALRERLGYGTGYPLLVAAVGGTRVGRDLLELTAEALAHLRKEQPEARMLMVTGPRIDPAELPDVEGLDRTGYVSNLFEHLACADAAVVQGGLSTTMELVAVGRPFVYFPLRHHWEQQHFVAHRLDRYRAGIRMDFASTSPADLSAAMIRALASKPRYRRIPRGGAQQAAERIAALIRR